MQLAMYCMYSAYFISEARYSLQLCEQVGGVMYGVGVYIELPSLVQRRDDNITCGTMDCKLTCSKDVVVGVAFIIQTTPTILFTAVDRNFIVRARDVVVPRPLSLVYNVVQKSIMTSSPARPQDNPFKCEVSHWTYC